MKFEVKIPAVGESITEATIGEWKKQNGEAIEVNDVILFIETDKASVEVVAEKAGVLEIKTQAGATIPIGTVVGIIDTDAKASVAAKSAQKNTVNPASATEVTTPTPSAHVSGGGDAHGEVALNAKTNSDLQGHLSPAVQKIVSEKHLDPASIAGTGRGGRLTKGDVLGANGVPAAVSKPVSMITSLPTKANGADQKRVPMTTIRKRIAERLVMSQQTTATLTTFNEIDMSKVMELRAKYKDSFKEKHQVGLGFMGFFVKASIEALRAFPAVNAFVEGTEIVYNNAYNVGVAVGTEKGLLVPVLKAAEQMTIAQIELAIRNYALKARDGKIQIDDLNGGTFTITNGGTYGSLMSTPILNPPQSGILGMHKIEDRAVVVKGEIVVRPMMYVALSYDHRIVDGKEAVSFLVKIKEGVEDPERLLIEV